MKVDYLAEGSDDCPLIRLYEFTNEEAKQLKNAIIRLASATLKELPLETLTHFESVDGTTLCFVTGTQDNGIVQTKGQEFKIILSPTSWDQVAGLIDPFTGGASGHQWLWEGPIRLLLSKDGRW
ncbi:MAG: hypothetical protein L0Y56_12560 [Nitrospira sp.]|nr:hypothetical protein [Nitrospira sp.]